MKATRQLGIRSGFTAASLAMVVTLALHPGAPARAEARDVASPGAQFPVRGAEPDEVRSSIAAVRAACTAWPRAVNPAQAGLQTASPNLVAIRDSRFCDFVDDPENMTWSVGMVAAILTTIGFVVAAVVIGLLRMILVAAWSWRPRRDLMPWA